MQCPKCNTVLKADAKFCKDCGARVSDWAETKAEVIQEQAATDAPAPEAKKSTTDAPAFEPKKSANKLVITIAIAVVVVFGVTAGYFVLDRMFGSNMNMMLGTKAPDNAENLNNTHDLSDAGDINESDFEDSSDTDALDGLNPVESPDEDMDDENIAGEVSSNPYESVMNEYILPDSDKRMLSAEEVSFLSKDDLALARNEIYARHGYVFNTEKYRVYFASKSWYTPDSSYVAGDATLNQFEIKNIQLIKSYEQ